MMLEITTRSRMTVSAVLCGLALALGAGYVVTASQPAGLFRPTSLTGNANLDVTGLIVAPH